MYTDVHRIYCVHLYTLYTVTAVIMVSSDTSVQVDEVQALFLMEDGSRDLDSCPGPDYQTAGQL